MMKGIKKLLVIFMICVISLGLFPSCKKEEEQHDYYEAALKFMVCLLDENGNVSEDLPASSPHVVDNTYKILQGEQLIVILIEGKDGEEVICEPMADAPSKYRTEADKEAGITSRLYNLYLNRIKESVSFTVASGISEQETRDTKKILTLIDVEISVKINDRFEDALFASEILNHMKVVLPYYIEEHMLVPTGYSGADCEMIVDASGITLVRK